MEAESGVRTEEWQVGPTATGWESQTPFWPGRKRGLESAGGAGHQAPPPQRLTRGTGRLPTTQAGAPTRPGVRHWGRCRACRLPSRPPTACPAGTSSRSRSRAHRAPSLKGQRPGGGAAAAGAGRKGTVSSRVSPLHPGLGCGSPPLSSIREQRKGSESPPGPPCRTLRPPPSGEAPSSPTPSPAPTLLSTLPGISSPPTHTPQNPSAGGGQKGGQLGGGWLTSPPPLSRGGNGAPLPRGRTPEPAPARPPLGAQPMPELSPTEPPPPAGSPRVPPRAGDLHLLSQVRLPAHPQALRPAVPPPPPPPAQLTEVQALL